VVENFPVGSRIIDFEAVREGLSKCSYCEQGTTKVKVVHE